MLSFGDVITFFFYVGLDRKLAPTDLIFLLLVSAVSHGYNGRVSGYSSTASLKLYTPIQWLLDSYTGHFIKDETEQMKV